MICMFGRQNNSEAKLIWFKAGKAINTSEDGGIGLPSFMMGAKHSSLGKDYHGEVVLYILLAFNSFAIFTYIYH